MSTYGPKPIDQNALLILNASLGLTELLGDEEGSAPDANLAGDLLDVTPSTSTATSPVAFPTPIGGATAGIPQAPVIASPFSVGRAAKFFPDRAGVSDDADAKRGAPQNLTASSDTMTLASGLAGAANDGLAAAPSSSANATLFASDGDRGITANISSSAPVEDVQDGSQNIDPSINLAQLLQMPGWLKLGGRLAEIALGAPASGSSPSTVVIDATASDGDGATLLQQLDAIGLQRGGSYGGDVSGILPDADVAKLPQIADLAHVYEDGATVDAAPIPDNAAVGMDVDDAASTYGATGAGVTVGILSDSFNVADTSDASGAADTMQTDILNGYLPVNTTILTEGPSGGTDEGRGMAEIVHEIAPGASILFASADYGQAAMANSILQMAADGAKVIIDDISYYDDTYYQQGVIAQAVDKVEAEGVTYLAAAGNFGSNGYQTNFNAGASFTYDDVTYTAANFSTGGSDLQNSLLPISGDLYGGNLTLQWSQPADSASSAAGDPGVGATGNLALFLTDQNGNIVDKLQSVDDDIGGDPYQDIYVDDDLIGNYYLRVGLQSGAAPANLKIMDVSDNAVTFGDTSGNQNSGTFYGHAAATGAIGVGAVDYALTPNEGTNPPISESYSSSGPDTIYFSPTGAALPTPTDDDVTLSGTDGVATSFFPGSLEDPASYNFFGTSAATPSVAGVVADMLSENPTLTPSQIKTDLENSAIATVDDDSGLADPLVGGAGLVQGDSALVEAGSPPPVIASPPSGSTVASLEPVIAGFGEAGAAINLTITNTDVESATSGTATVAASGVWTYTPAAPLLGGSYSVTATQTNASGSPSPASSADNFTVDAILTAPTINGAEANQAADESQTIKPFADVVIADPNVGSQTETVTITPSTTLNGFLTDPNASTDFSSSVNGALTLTGAAGAVTSEIDQLTFTPTFNNESFGQSAATGFVINDTDTAGVTATNAATSLVVTQGDPDAIAPFAAAGADPQGGLIPDANGDLYGELQNGGAHGDGEIYEIVNQGTAAAPVYASTPTGLYDFTGGADGDDLSGGLHFDAVGNLLGVATNNSGGTGDVFELVNQGTASAPAFTGATPTNYDFSSGANGYAPVGGLVADAEGNLYGATLEAGSFNHGVIYEFANQGATAAPMYAGEPLAVSNIDLDDDYSGLAIDTQGNLFGVQQYAGGGGDAFELAAGAGSTNSPAPYQTVIASFNQISASNPDGGLVVDGNGNLFGVTAAGGADGDGTIYELVKNTTSYSLTRLHSFAGSADGSAPIGALTLDAKGDIFGTTTSGGEFGFGTVFELVNTGAASAPNYATTTKILLNFDVANGADPVGGMTFNGAGDLVGVTTAGGPTGDGLIFEVPACYCRGARIATERGEIAVEDLRIGDLAVTTSGVLRPIRWIGHRRIDISRHPDPATVRPVRVSAGAFGEGLPRRDLWLSPGHNVASGGALMPIIALTNGISIAQVDAREVEYWHVELDAHDILLAEGLPAESYLDCGNRTAFVNGGAFIEAYPDFAPKHWADTCLPLVQQGPELVRTKARLLEILRTRGFETTCDSDPHIIADGRRIEPNVVSPMQLSFDLPEGCRDIVLVSRRFTPAHVIPENFDTRELGLCVARLSVDGVDLPLERGDLFEDGWREAEWDDGRAARRWTAGAARLRPGARTVLVDLESFGLYYWRRCAEDHFALFA